MLISRSKMFAQQFALYGMKLNLNSKLLSILQSRQQFLHHQVKELEIPVPWGKVAGKLWGTQDKQPILAMHGWQDNAGSFDLLAPLIAKNTPVLAIDLPGHGFSSWLPPGFMYAELVYILLIKRIKRYFGWEKVKILAHSLSSMTAYWYASCFPTELQYVITLDFFKFPSIDVPFYVTIFPQAVETFLKLEASKNVQPSYSESEITKKLLEGYISLDDAACKILMIRGTTRRDDGMYVFNRDPKLKVMPVHTMFSKEQLEEFAKLITCPYLVLKGENSAYVEDEENFHNALKIMKDFNKNVYYEEVPGEHHFHLTNAENAAVFINTFLKKYDCPP